MKVAIVGSRGFNDMELLRATLEEFRGQITLIVSGGAKGADTLGEQYAKENGIPTLIFKPDWEKHGKAAGFIRNKDIVENADTVVAMWDGASHGTENSIQHGYKMNKRVKIVIYTPAEVKPPTKKVKGIQKTVVDEFFG